MYYGLLAFTVCLFGAAFAVNQQYQQRMGSGFFVAFFFSALSACGGICILFPINGFRLEFTPFTLIMALVNASVSISYTFCGLKALGKINLSIKKAVEEPAKEARPPKREERPRSFTPRPQPQQRPAPVGELYQAQKSADSSFEDKLKQFMQESDSRMSGNKLYEQQKKSRRRR